MDASNNVSKSVRSTAPFDINPYATVLAGLRVRKKQWKLLGWDL